MKYMKRSKYLKQNVTKKISCVLYDNPMQFLDMCIFLISKMIAIKCNGSAIYLNKSIVNINY